MFWKRLLIIPPVVAGFAVICAATANRSQPEIRDISERAVPVAYIVADTRSFVPRVNGFGIVESARSWNAVAQVQGRITELHPEFVRGAMIRAGQGIARIDPETYALAVAKAEANVRSGAAQIAELDANAEATRAAGHRTRGAGACGTRVGPAARAGRTPPPPSGRNSGRFSANARPCNRCKNRLNIVPAQLDALEQALAVSGASLDQARIDPDRTRVVAPLDGRVATADVDIGEFVSPGSRLGTLDGVATAQTDAPVAPWEDGSAGPVHTDGQRMTDRPGAARCRRFRFFVVSRSRQDHGRRRSAGPVDRGDRHGEQPLRHGPRRRVSASDQEHVRRGRT